MIWSYFFCKACGPPTPAHFQSLLDKESSELQFCHSCHLAEIRTYADVVQYLDGIAVFEDYRRGLLE